MECPILAPLEHRSWHLCSQGGGSLKPRRCFHTGSNHLHYSCRRTSWKTPHAQQDPLQPQLDAEDALVDAVLSESSFARRADRRQRLQPPPIQCLPPIHECKHMVNLTNGIEALPVLHKLGLPYSFVRIQSTACEQQMWERLICDLDANLLVSLALGQCCLVWDYGCRHRATGNPRALWVGLEFVRYALTKVWLGSDAAAQCGALTRGYNVSGQYDDYLRGFSRSTLRYMRYFAKWLHPETTVLRLHGVYSLTAHDDDDEFYRRVLFSHQDPSNPNSSVLRHTNTQEESNQKFRQGPTLAGKPEDLHGTEALLARYGMSVYYRGLSNVEYQQQKKELRRLSGESPEMQADV